jgi:hypothetical protein
MEAFAATLVPSVGSGGCVPGGSPPSSSIRWYTDPTRLRATDPGQTRGNPVFLSHDAFNANREEVADLQERYRQGTVGYVEVM